MITPVAVITGSSGGIGRDTAELLFERGYTVFGLSRSKTEDSGIIHIYCDLSDRTSVSEAINKVVSQTGGIDLLINNAGMGISGAVEFTEELDMKNIFDVNFFGAVHVIKAALPFLRKSNKGRIINICSVASDFAIPFQSFYSASKSALLSLSLSIRNELKPFGIKVAAVLPGDTATGFTDKRKKNHNGDELYSGRIERSVSRMEKDEINGMPSSFVAKKIVSIASRRRVKPKYVIGFKYILLSIIVRFLPVNLYNWIVGLMYSS